MDELQGHQTKLIKTLIEEAANNASEGITISSMSEPDRALVYVNEGFERLTGYTRDDVLGKNCRFLQGKETDQREVDKVREAIEKGTSCTVELLNFKKDSTPFWNRLSIAPIRDDHDRITHYVGIQSDITELRETRARLERANLTLEQFRHRITRELQQARMSQAFLLPAHLPRSGKVCFASKFVPMDEIGGDYFDVLELDNGIYGMLIADVTGHGIPAALLTFMVSTTFKNTAPGVTSSMETISQTNRKLYAKMPENAFVTMFYTIYNAHLNQLCYTQAGHPDGILMRTQTQEIIPLSTAGGLVGFFSFEEITFAEHDIALRKGDKVILYTDAITDALDALRQEQGEDPLYTFLRQHWDLDLDRLFEEIYHFGLESTEAVKYPDDFTLVGFEVLSDG